jgi:tRNA(fMet)-specific endonuclease VapC
MVFALDTNIIIKYLRNELSAIQNFRNAVVANHRLVTATRKRTNYDMLLQDCKIAEMDVLSWKRAEKIYENLYRKGFTVGELDMLIAAYCLTHGCTIVTNNTKDFENIDGLEIVDWA